MLNSLQLSQRWLWIQAKRDTSFWDTIAARVVLKQPIHGVQLKSLRKSYSKSRFKYSHILLYLMKWISVKTFRFNTATSIVFVCFFYAGTATVGVIIKSIVCALAFVLIWQLYGEKNVTAVVVCMQISQCSTVSVLLLTWKWACIFQWVQTTSMKMWCLWLSLVERVTHTDVSKNHKKMV